MKVKISMKTPDALHHALEDVPEELHEDVVETWEKWSRYSEYVDIEIDTEKDTCTIIKQS